ncbi:MAG: folylpolyglutamate synthase/dihydrofolate synthase family protein [Bacteroidales bacterium]
MTYQQAIDHLFNQLPMYQRIGPAAYKANLDNTLALSEYLGAPERRFKSIHIAGTNGKGSVAHMLASVLQEHGLKTGLATSPHLKDFRERIRINGKMIPKRAVARFAEKHRPFFEPLHASFFEIGIALTFQYFAEQEVDIAVVETGLGGRLDSTNILLPELSVITGIHFDHTALLGNTLEKIAIEKAGIIKPGVPVVVGRKQKEVHHVFEQAAGQKKAPLYVAGELIDLLSSDVVAVGKRPMLRMVTDSRLGNGLEVQSDLIGNYQKENVLTALAALLVLDKGAGFSLSLPAILKGLAVVQQNTGLAGRWQIIGRRPAIICDTAHNAEGIRMVFDQLSQQRHTRLHVVFGTVDDKDLQSIFEILPRDARYYFCKPDVPRGLDAEILGRLAAGNGLNGMACPTVKKALSMAKKQAAPSDLIFVGGSTFVVAEVL